MSIQDIKQKINTYIDLKQLFWVVSIFGVVFLVVGLIGLSLNTATASQIEITTFDGPVLDENLKPVSTEDTVYASKSGTRYYYADCAGLKRVKPENRVSFTSKELAEKAGYTKAANCH